MKTTENISDATALIIFVRNPVLGKVKTRLAATVGNEKALEIYRLLLEHTHDITQELACHKFVFYADDLQLDDLWENGIYNKQLQQGDDLGTRMGNAFSSLFSKGCKSICIIGSDCIELSSHIIEEAFEQLRTNDAVIGPSLDGGYYLLGMNKLIPGIFDNKNWSTDEVLPDTISSISAQGLDCFLLAALSDIDNEEDWEKYGSSLR